MSKRKSKSFIKTIVFLLTIVFSKTHLTCCQMSNPNLSNRAEKIKILELHNKTTDAPSISFSIGARKNFSTRPSPGKSIRKITSYTHTQKYRHPTVPKLKQGLQLGGRPNPGGSGEDPMGNPKTDKCYSQKPSQEIKKTHYNGYKKRKKRKKKKPSQEIKKPEEIKIISRIKENKSLIREAEIAGKNINAQKDINHLKEQLLLGNRNPGIGTKKLTGMTIFEARGFNQGRVYFQEKNGIIEILAKSNKQNQDKVISILRKMGY